MIFLLLGWLGLSQQTPSSLLVATELLHEVLTVSKYRLPIYPSKVSSKSIVCGRFITPILQTSTANHAQLGIRIINAYPHPSYSKQAYGVTHFSFTMAEVSNPLFEEKSIFSTKTNRIYEVGYDRRVSLDVDSYASSGVGLFLRGRYFSQDPLLRCVDFGSSNIGFTIGFDLLTPWGGGITIQGGDTGAEATCLFQKGSFELLTGVYGGLYIPAWKHRHYEFGFWGKAAEVRYTNNSVTYSLKWTFDSSNGRQWSLNVKCSPLFSRHRGINFLFKDRGYGLSPTRFNVQGASHLATSLRLPRVVDSFTDHLINNYGHTLPLTNSEVDCMMQLGSTVGIIPFNARFHTDITEINRIRFVKPVLKFLQTVEDLKSQNPNTLLKSEDIILEEDVGSNWRSWERMHYGRIIYPLRLRNTLPRKKLLDLVCLEHSDFDSDERFFLQNASEVTFALRGYYDIDMPGFSHEKRELLFRKLFSLKVAVQLSTVSLEPWLHSVLEFYPKYLNFLNTAEKIAGIANVFSRGSDQTRMGLLVWSDLPVLGDSHTAKLIRNIRELPPGISDSIICMLAQHDPAARGSVELGAPALNLYLKQVSSQLTYNKYIRNVFSMPSDKLSRLAFLFAQLS